MNKSIADIRKDYSSRSLDSADVLESPVEQFNTWLTEAIAAGALEATAMNLATVDAAGKPSSRIVLLKGIDQGGFIFYTNYESNKGKDMGMNLLAALNFFWPELERQVRIQGAIERMSPEDSDAYFTSRPYGSRIGAWVSDQSKRVSKEELKKKTAEYMLKYPEGSVVPRPPHWGGYRLIPTYVEFWQGRPSRLHDRIVYELSDKHTWEIYRISP